MPQQGKGAGYLSRQWLACVCERCMADDFEKCKHRDFLTAAGKWWNKPEMKHLPGMVHTEKTKEMCIKKSLTVFIYLSFIFSNLTFCFLISVHDGGYGGSIYCNPPR